MHKVLIHPADYQDCQEAVDRAFRLFPGPVTGRTVFVKPNVLRPARPEEAITTHPAILTAVLNALERMDPARIIVGDNPGLHGYGANEASFERSGLLAASGPHFRNIGQEARDVPFRQDYGGTVSVSRAVLDADVFISLPKFKTHGLTVITGGIKNSYGIIPGALKAAIHRTAGSPERFQEVVTDVFAIRPPDLVIMDAVLGMQGNGPASTELRWVGKVLASDNAVALDAVVARMMGVDPGSLAFLRRAKELGLGDYDESAIDIEGTLQVIEGYQVPVPAETQDKTGKLQELFAHRTSMRPTADPALCTGCGTCVEQCPVQALSLWENVAVVDAEKCIACFCCQEMCPEKAITLTARQ